MSIIRLHVIAEGPTELSFVKDVLASHLCSYNIFIDVRSVVTKKSTLYHKKTTGGMTTWDKAKYDITTWMKEDANRECRFTTMFDLYGLPKDFPGIDCAKKVNDPYEKVRIIEDKIMEEVNDTRLIPYIQLHEFESLILADPRQLDYEYLEHEKQISQLVEMVGNQNPELINDSYETAPSRRILKEIPEYIKTTSGPVVVKKIGLPVLREKCRHFGEWLSKLEKCINC